MGLPAELARQAGCARYSVPLAGAEGIEPPYQVLETCVLPLNYTPKILSAFLFTFNKFFCQLVGFFIGILNSR